MFFETIETDEFLFFIFFYFYENALMREGCICKVFAIVNRKYMR